MVVVVVVVFGDCCFVFVCFDFVLVLWVDFVCVCVCVFLGRGFVVFFYVSFLWVVFFRAVFVLRFANKYFCRKFPFYVK